MEVNCGYIRPGEWQCNCHLTPCYVRLKEDNAELNQLFDLQHRRMGEATEKWHSAGNDRDVYPDLGDLLKWLCDTIDRLTLEKGRKTASHAVLMTGLASIAHFGNDDDRTEVQNLKSRADAAALRVRAEDMVRAKV